MLVKHNQQSFEQIIELLTMRIRLTESLAESLRNERGAAHTNPFELRSASRFKCFGEGIVTFTPESFQMPEQESPSLVIVRDLSRKGIGILSHQQWYPEQEVQLQMEHATVFARIARARRLAPFCYEVGLIIVKYQPVATPS